MLYLCLEEFITSFSLPPEGERLRVFGNLGDLFRSLAELYSPLRKNKELQTFTLKQWHGIKGKMVNPKLLAFSLESLAHVQK